MAIHLLRTASIPLAQKGASDAQKTFFWITLVIALAGITIWLLLYVTMYSPGAVRRLIAIPIPEEAIDFRADAWPRSLGELYN